MRSRRLFTIMDIDSRRFYSRILNTATFNMYAVRHKLFGELICESDDPSIMVRWTKAESLIMEAISHGSATDAGDDCTCRDY